MNKRVVGEAVFFNHYKHARVVDFRLQFSPVVSGTLSGHIEMELFDTRAGQRLMTVMFHQRRDNSFEYDDRIFKSMNLNCKEGILSIRTVSSLFLVKAKVSVGYDYTPKTDAVIVCKKQELRTVDEGWES